MFTLVERGRVGGTAFNSGPAPARRMLSGRAPGEGLELVETFGLRGDRPRSTSLILANAQRVAGYLDERKRVADHIRSVGVDLIEEAGDARLIDANTVAAVDGRRWMANWVIIAVGGKAWATAHPRGRARPYRPGLAEPVLPARPGLHDWGGRRAASSRRSWRIFGCE